MSRGGGGAQPPPRPGAQRSSLLPTARLERRRRQQASLKEKEMIVSLACPRGRPQPRPRCLPRTPAQVLAPRAGPQPPPRALTQGRGARPAEPVRGSPQHPPIPPSPPGLIPGPLPTAPPGPHSSPPAACKASECSPARDGAPSKIPGPRGAPERGGRATKGVGPGALLLGHTMTTSLFFPLRQTFSGVFRGSAWEGAPLSFLY